MVTRDGKMTICFGSAHSFFFRPGPAHNTIFNFRFVWACYGPYQNLIILMFYNKTTNFGIVRKNLVVYSVFAQLQHIYKL